MRAVMKGVNYFSKSVILIILVVLMGCGSSKQLVEGMDRKISKGNPPDWVTHHKKKDTRTHRAVVGVSKNYAMESSARSDAILQAQKEAITLISSSVARHIKEALASESFADDIVDEGTVKKDVTEVIAQSEFEGRVEEYYIEKREKYSGGALRQYYKAYALVLFPRNLAEISAKKVLERARLAAQTEARKNQIKKAEEAISKGIFDW